MEDEKYTKVVVFIRERRYENSMRTDLFLTKDTENPEQSFRDAVKEYLLTPDGEKAIEESCEDFNWGDAMARVPNETWEKHGIKPLQKGDNVTFQSSVEIVVNQDEVLVPHEYYEVDDELSEVG